jgi:hypothetical protein
MTVRRRRPLHPAALLRASLLAATAALLLAACAGPPPPDWALDASAALRQVQAAALEGRDRVEAAEFARAKAQLARTGRADWLARAELLRCAAHAARLDAGDCPGFEALRADATLSDAAYADLLAGRLQPAQLPLLPAHHRRAALGDAAAMTAVADPLAQLLVAATLLRAGRADAAVVAQAVDAASAQGWRRALLAWLHVQRRQAEQAGDTAAAERVQRRIDVAAGLR